MGKSYLYGSTDDAQALVERYSGTGIPKFDKKGRWVKKEFVTAPDPIGVYVNQDTGEEIQTRRFAIHYGKNGVHIVPAKEIEE